MKNKQKSIFILIMITGITFLGCEAMATLFHGEKPEPPPLTYTITFNANGASGTPPETQTVNEGAVIRLPDRGGLSKGSDIFAGWNESASGGTIYSIGASITVTGDMVFYAQWLDGSTPQYTVTFNANGATSGASPASQTVYSGISITVPAQGTLAYSGKTFGGWNTQSNGGGTNYAVGATFTVTGNVTLYAKWQSEVQYTVTYNANGASGTAPATQTFDPGTEITLPGAGAMTNLGKMFEGWNTNAGGTGTSYAEGAAYTVTANITFYAQWVTQPDSPQGENPPGNTIAEKLAYIANNAGDGTVYDIAVSNNVYMGPATVSTMGRNITVIIRSASSADIKTIQFEGQGYLFSVDANVTLKLENIVLKGTSTNTRALVMIGAGKLILNSGSKITLNTNTSSAKGGGVYINGGVLEMNIGCEITENRATASGSKGGGIYVENKGTILIYGGLISGNRADGVSYYHGGGIYITGSSNATMSGGVISKNYADSGGGIYINDSGSSFIKRSASGTTTSGIIYGSTGENANLDYVGGTNALCRAFGSKRKRGITLGNYDEISTFTDDGWEQ
jgi:uncharacterized repeat protein (TIGR02543 family)